jgi:hypothetical protein
MLHDGIILVIGSASTGLVAAATTVSHAMRSMLFGVSTLDVWAFGAATSGLASAALVGCGIPARRAARQDPMVTLRLE